MENRSRIIYIKKNMVKMVNYLMDLIMCKIKGHSLKIVVGKGRFSEG